MHGHIKNLLDKNVDYVFTPFIINAEGKEILPMVYDKICENGEGFIRIGKNGKCGLINYQGEEITPLKYNHISAFFDNDIAIYFIGKMTKKGKHKNGKFGIIDINGKEITPAIYDDIDLENIDIGKIRVLVNGEWYYINTNGERIE